MAKKAIDASQFGNIDFSLEEGKSPVRAVEEKKEVAVLNIEVARITLRLPKYLKDTVDELAYHKRKSMNDFICKAIKNYIDSEENQEILTKINRK